MTRYPVFDRRRLCLKSLAERASDVRVSDCVGIDRDSNYEHPELPSLARAIVAAREAARPVIAMIGAHVVKAGLSRYLIDLMERGLCTLVATNGAGVIHDFELAYHGATSEDVARYIRQGEFGLWSETGHINDIVRDAAWCGDG